MSGKSNENFFNEAASFYDEMISFNEALKRRISMLSNFTAGIENAADVGCGTGLDSIALAKSGIKVTGFDLSEGMLEQAKRNAVNNEVMINFVLSSAGRIPSKYFNSFSLVLSLGNTLANLNEKELGKAVKNFYAILTGKGKLLVQVLNYSKIVSEKERIVNITSKEDSFYIRFYDFGSKKINFNILRFNQHNTGERALLTTTIYPHSYEQLTTLLREVGFTEIKLWENFNRSLFVPGSSSDLIIEAVKQ